MKATAPLTYCSHTLAGEELYLLPQKAIYWPAQQTLLLADLHLGKAGHFRKAGIAVPMQVHFRDIQVLEELVVQWQPRQVIFLGDLFHSSYNEEWQLLEEWMQQHPAISFILIKGNHDILPEAIYRDSVLRIEENKMVIFPFLLTHQPPEANTETGGLYTLCGHIHPAIQLTGIGKQHISLPCFYFGLHYGLLPAFGKFTGFYKIKPKAGEGVYAILPDKVIAIKP